MTVIHGITVESKVKALLLGSDGGILVSTDTPSMLQPIGSSNRYTNLNLPAGQSFQIAFTAAASTRYIVDGISLIYTGAVAGVNIRPFLYDGANRFVLGTFAPIVSTYSYFTPCSIVLEAGWSTGCTVTGATLNDDIDVITFLRQIK